MKQCITIEQLDELTIEQGDKLYEWYQGIDSFENSELPPLLNIGEMIYFIDDYSKKDWRIDTDYFQINGKGEEFFEYTVRWANDKGQIGFIAEDGNHLCDALWLAVKEILGK